MAKRLQASIAKPSRPYRDASEFDDLLLGTLHLGIHAEGLGDLFYTR